MTQIQAGGNPQEPPRTIPGEGDDAPRPSTHEVEAQDNDDDIDFELKEDDAS